MELGGQREWGGEGGKGKNKIERRKADPRGAVRDRQRSHCSKSIKEEKKKKRGQTEGKDGKGGGGGGYPRLLFPQPPFGLFFGASPPHQNLPLPPRLGHTKKSPPGTPPANSHRGLEGGGGTIGAPPKQVCGCGVRGERAPPERCFPLGEGGEVRVSESSFFHWEAGGVYNVIA